MQYPGFRRILDSVGFLPALALGILVSVPLYSQGGTRVFVWVRPASEADLRLSTANAPNLRKLARCGATLPRIATLDTDILASELRKSGALLPEGKFREIGQKTGAAAKASVLSLIHI